MIVLLFVDKAFGASLNDQRTRFQGRVIGTELYNPDFAKLAGVFGARGIRVEPENIGKALEESVRTEKPTVIEIPAATLPPPFQIPRRPH